jgi:hypothetical protein
MKKGTFLISIILGVVCVVSCKKNQTSYPDYKVVVPQLLMDYGYFKNGTYWVFQDSASLVRDSVYITSSNQGVLNTTPDNSHPYHGYFGYFNIYFLSSFEGRQYHNFVNTQFTFNGHTELFEDKLIGADSLKETDLMSDFLVTGQPDPDGSYPVSFRIRFDSLKIANIYFRSVLVFHDEKNATQNNSITNFFISRNIGIVRKETSTPFKVWNLVKYNIVQ